MRCFSMHPGDDVTFWEFRSNALAELAKFAEAKNVQRMLVGGLDNVRGQLFLCAFFPFLCADLRQLDAHVVESHRQLGCVVRQCRKGGLCSTTWCQGGLCSTTCPSPPTSGHERERLCGRASGRELPRGGLRYGSKQTEPQIATERHTLRERPHTCDAVLAGRTRTPDEQTHGQRDAHSKRGTGRQTPASCPLRKTVLTRMLHSGR